MRKFQRPVRGMVAKRKRRPHTGGHGRERMLHFGVARKRYLAFVPLLLIAILLAAWVKTPAETLVRFRPARHAITNPLMGWAPDATTDPEALTIPCSLVHATLTWRELEPEQGTFDFEAFEKKNHFGEWRAAGKRLVLRFVMDMPGELPHRDIPYWVVRLIGPDEAGSYYESYAGQGFAPDYNNELLQQLHSVALAKLGERYDTDPFVAFVEMGSLGFFGEWWVDGHSGAPAMPLLPDARAYASAYAYAFPETALLMTSPYQSAKLLASGLYNPKLGDTDATWNWIDMATYGGYEDQIGTDLRGFGAQYPNVLVGAQLSREINPNVLLGSSPEQLIDQLRECHASYVSGIPGDGLSETAESSARVAQQTMGYRLWVRQATWPKQARRGAAMRVSLTIRNSGVAAMSQAWPVQLSLSKGGELVYADTLRVNVKNFRPGESRLQTTMELPIDLPVGDYQLGLSILDPTTGEPAVELAMVSIKQGLTSILGDVKVVS